MRLHKSFLLALVLVFIEIQTSHAAEVEDLYPLVRHELTGGVDAWHFSVAEPEQLLLLANNSTWRYRSVSPWFKGVVAAQLSNNVSFQFRGRADQSLGGHVDEMNLSWQVLPKLGINAGIVSYKTTWCRTYDVDSPWVRESNPFCNVSTTSEAVGGAPGAEVFIKLPIANYQIQAQAGVYRPLIFDYNTTEFSNAQYPNATIYQNEKTGFALSALNLDTSTEVRLGFLHTNQAEYVYSQPRVEPFRNKQVYDVVFAGIAFNINPSVYARAQMLRHNMTASYWSEPWSQRPKYEGGTDLIRDSKVLEVGYFLTPRDTVALALSEYVYDNSYIKTLYPAPGYKRYPSYYLYKNRSYSVSWRHDWARGFFSALQLTRNVLEITNTFLPVRVDHSASAFGLGFRLGYQF